MKKILILCNNCAGLYQFRREVVEELIKNNYEVYISTPYDDLDIIKKLKNMNTNVMEIKIDRRGCNFIKDLVLIIKYLKLVFKIKPNIVLTYTIKPNLYGGLVCKMLGIPYIMNITGLGSSLEHDGFLKSILSMFYGHVMKKAKMVFFQNKQNKDYFIKKLKYKMHYFVLPGSGVNLNYYRYIEYPNENIIKFVFVARIMKEKGIEEYLGAAKYIKNMYNNVEFHICGSCEEEYENIISSLQKDGIIIYHGEVKDMRVIYKKIHCTVHPTYYPEGLSNVLLESCASGRPIITTNRPGCREVIENNLNGFIVEERNVDDLKDKINNFLKLSWDKKKEMGINGRKKVEKEFNRDIVVKKYIDVISKK